MRLAAIFGVLSIGLLAAQCSDETAGGPGDVSYDGASFDDASFDAAQDAQDGSNTSDASDASEMSDTSSDGGQGDAAAMDAGTDAGQPDGGQGDASATDTGTDAGQPDGGHGDAGFVDAGSDGALPDAGADAGAADGGQDDAGQNDAGITDAGSDAGTVDVGTDGGAGYAGDPYDIGNPTLVDLYVSPTGDDGHTGLSQQQALRTITAAWAKVPQSLTTTGYRINLMPGTYPCEPGPENTNCQNWFADRTGTYAHPLIVRALNGKGTATVRGGINTANLTYVYFIDLKLAGGQPLPVNSSGNNLLHLENGDHILIRGCELAGPACSSDSCNNLQEVLKVNQTDYLYVEDSTIGGAWHTSVDYMVAQYGHFINNNVHTAGQWGMYIKGGSAYHRIEGNEFHDSQLGFSAGQAANYPLMVSPWLHYEVYDVKFVNNVLHDIQGVGVAVTGGYNVLVAHNTLYRVGIAADPGYSLMNFVHGERGCTATTEIPNAVSVCQGYIASGGWGPNYSTDSVAGIPNRNVFVYNNLMYNPAGTQTLYEHFYFAGPINPPSGFQNVPRPTPADTNLALAGNIIYNGPSNHPLGNEDSGRGCQPSNPTCNTTRISADNAIHVAVPQLVNAPGGDYHPTPGGNVATATGRKIPDFTWTDAPASPTVPAGNTSNAISRTKEGASRNLDAPGVGAY